MKRQRRRAKGTGVSERPSAAVHDAVSASPPAAAASREPFRAYAMLIFGVALMARLVHIWQLRASPFFSVLMGDSRGYDEWARRLAAGDWIGAEVFYQAPLYPYFLGVIYALVGPDLLIVRVVQAVLGSLACVLLGLAGARLFSTRAGLIAGLILALYAPMIFLHALIQKSILDVFFVCLVLWLVSELSVDPLAAGAPDARSAAGRNTVTSRRSRLVWLGLGVALGALSLTRENALVFVAVVFAWASYIAWRRPGPTGAWTTRPAGPLAVLVGLIVVLAPVAMRNKLVGGGIYLTTSQFGSNLYIGNNPRADGTYMALREGRGDPAYERQDATELAEQALGRRLSPGEVSAFWRDRAIQFITSDPAQWLTLMGRKIVLLLNATEMLDTEAQESHVEWSVPLRLGSYVGHFGLLLPLALLGVIVTWDDRRRLWVIYAMALAYAASIVMFFVVARYRYPLVPFLVLFAAAGLARVPAFVRDAPPVRKWVAAGLIVGVALVTRWPILSGDVMRAITETNLGVALQAKGQLDTATTHYRRAMEIRPDYAPAHNNLGVVLRAQGKLDEAISAYRQALAERPDYAEVHSNLATALLELRKPEEAVTHFQIARQTIPLTAGAHNNFGVALSTAGRRDEAITEFRAALAMEPDSTTTRRNLGDALAKERRYPEAIEHFRRIADLDASNPGAHYDFGNVLMEAGRLPEAALEYRTAIKLAPDSPQAHNNLGVALAAQGQIEAAIAEFQQAIALKPDFVEAQRYLAMALRSRRR